MTGVMTPPGPRPPTDTPRARMMVDAAMLAGMRVRVHALLTEPDGPVEANCGHVASRWEFCAPCLEILSGQAEFAQEEEEVGVDDATDETADDAV